MTISRRRQLASSSLIALSLYSGPALASCLYSGNDQTISTTDSGCVGWSSGNFSITNTGTISSSTAGVSITGSNGTGTLTNSGSISGTSYGVLNAGMIGAVTVESGGLIHGNTYGIYNSISSATIDTLTVESGGTISGSSIGIANAGSITAAINNGLISGGEGIVDNSLGRIGSLVNTGTIEGNTYGIYNAGGTIGTFSNSGSVTGGNAGLDNTGSIGTATNTAIISGTGSGTTYGIRNSGTITALTNGSGGTISGGLYGAYNAGNIGTLTNSGTISAPTAIENASTGTLGPIANSGVLAGNIVNAAARDLTIDGGSGTTFGTLTGFSGGIGSADEGTITNTSSNLVFGSGNVLLNDAINVGSHTVTNSGATIEIANPVSITGAYQQSGGGLVAEAASSSSYGYLTISSNATVANASIVIKGSGLANGSSFTIVRSGATGSYTGDSASVIGTSGLTATVQSVGNELVVSLGFAGGGGGGGGSFTAIGDAAGGVAAWLGPVLDEINGSNSPSAVAFQNAVLTPLAELPSGQQGQAIKELAPVQNNFQDVYSMATTLLNVIEQHQQTAMAYDPDMGEAAGSGIRPSSLWAQTLGGGAQSASNAEAAGYNSTDYGFAAGFDHLFSPDLLGGVAASWLRAGTNGIDSASGQSSTLDNYQLTFYGTYRFGRAFIDGQLGAGWNRFDQNRAISFLGETAKANYDGQQYLASAEAGYDVPVGGFGGLTVTPLLGLRWLRADNGAYSESGAGAADLSVAGQAIDGLTQELGVRTSWRFATPLGMLEPELTAAWVHDYTHGPIATSGLIGGEAFAVTTPRSAADGARIGIAATLVHTDRLSFRAEYDGELRPGYLSDTGLFRAVWQF